ncbi:minichromosome maintenance protein MCM [Candidatus Woesearchaeota archaeon]|nr:minichromosome maintenance protein MCM [Candidatus Woesearchaeota archaeon]
MKKFQEFIEIFYLEELQNQIMHDRNFIVIDFATLSGFSPEISDKVLEEPVETIQSFELAIEQIQLSHEIKKFKIRFSNLPPSRKVLIKNVRSKHLGKLLNLEGTIRQKGDVRPQVTSAKFECPSCGNIQTIIQLDQKFSEPTKCACGRKGKFKLIDKEMIDLQGLVLEEATENLEGGEQPRRMQVVLKDDLVSPISEKKTNPGSKVKICGIVTEVPIPAKDGGKLTRFDLVFEANFVESIQEDYSEIEISEEKEQELIEISMMPDVMNKIIDSFAPGIYGHEKVKEAILLQFVGGVQKKRGDGVKNRGDIHILLIGDPGAGKSQLLKRAQVLAPKGRYVSGKGASGAGLTAAVVRDEFMKGWALEAGALVLANKGICLIDELDKMTPEDRSAMHEALEQQSVTISKANIQATLTCETTVLAAANPKFGRFDPFSNIARQIDLPPALISRFDLIFPIRDIPKPDADERLADFILNMHQENTTKEPAIDTETLKLYIIYARKTFAPELSTEALEEIKQYYLKMRNSGSKDEDGIQQAIPITARQLEAMVRLAEASAKLRYSTVVEKQDGVRATELMQYWLNNMGIDPDSGKIDIDKITSGITSTERNKIGIVRVVIDDLEKKHGKKIPYDEVLQICESKSIPKERTEEIVEKMIRKGDLYRPDRDSISKI